MCADYDHAHCLTCYRPAYCSALAEAIGRRDQAQCPIVSCRDGCGHSLHECKLADHRLVCSAVVTHCLNVAYGCPARLPRSQLGVHLFSCPASVVVCSALWCRRRWRQHDHDQPPEELSSRRGQHCPLDVQLAWRDQLCLRSCEQREQSTLKELTAPDEQMQSSPVLIDRYSDTECVHGLGGGLCRMCTAPATVKAPTMVPPRPRWVCQSAPHTPGELSWRVSNDIPSATDDRIEFPNTRRVSVMVEREAVLRYIRQQRMAGDARNRRPDSVPLSDSHLHLSLAQEHAPTGCSRDLSNDNHSYRLNCGELVRRDELPDHRKLWHEVLAAPNWLQTVCPLRQYGCPFYSDRLVPNILSDDCTKQLCLRDEYQGTGDGGVDSMVVLYDELSCTESCPHSSPSSTVHDDSNKQVGIDAGCNGALLDSASSSVVGGLCSLPTELLVQIASYLDGCSLRQFAATCRLLRQIAATHLPTRGMVIMSWKKTEQGGANAKKLPLFEETAFKWRFSRNMRLPAPSAMVFNQNGDRHLVDHLSRCQHWSATRHQQPFCVLPPALKTSDKDLSTSPLDLSSSLLSQKFPDSLLSSHRRNAFTRS